jgi:hypothetical protein
MKTYLHNTPDIEYFHREDITPRRPLPADCLTLEAVVQAFEAPAFKQQSSVKDIELEPRKVPYYQAIRLGKAAIATLLTRDFAVVSVTNATSSFESLTRTAGQLERFIDLTGNGLVLAYEASGANEPEAFARRDSVREMLGALSTPAALIYCKSRVPSEQVSAEASAELPELAITF